jgi:oligopeptidase B
VPRTITLHGDPLVDPYFWLRERTTKEVIDYLAAENAYTEAVMKPAVALQAKLYCSQSAHSISKGARKRALRGAWIYARGVRVARPGLSAHREAAD